MVVTDGDDMPSRIRHPDDRLSRHENIRRGCITGEEAAKDLEPTPDRHPSPVFFPKAPGGATRGIDVAADLEDDFTYVFRMCHPSEAFRHFADG